MSIRIAITDDHSIVTQGLQLLLNNEQGIKVVAIFSDGVKLMKWLSKNNLDVLLLDVYLQDFSGLDLCKSISTLYPSTAIIAVSGQNEGIVISQMLQNGALGYVLKNAESNEIVEAILAVHAGNQYLCKRTRKALLKSDKPMLSIPKITRREKDVLVLIEEGLTTSEIAGKLFISPHTVESHRKNLIEKFDAKSTASVIHIVKKLGLI